MADVPHEAPHVAAKSGLQSLKKLPPWAIISILGGGVLLMLLIRHNKAAAKDSTTAPDPNTNPTDPNAGVTPYNDPSNLNQPYYTDPTGGLGGFVSGGALGSPVLPSPVGPTTPTDTGGGGTTAPSGGIINSFAPTVSPTISPTFSPVVTGGGAPAKPGAVHTVPKPAATPRYMWDAKKKKWVLGSSEGYHYDTKTKKWVK